MAEKSIDASKGHINDGYSQDNGDEKVCIILIFVKPMTDNAKLIIKLLLLSIMSNVIFSDTLN